MPMNKYLLVSFFLVLTYYWATAVGILNCICVTLSYRMRNFMWSCRQLFKIGLPEAAFSFEFEFFLAATPRNPDTSMQYSEIS